MNDFTKPGFYKTRAGGKAVVYGPYKGGILVYYGKEDGERHLANCGNYLENGPHVLDLVGVWEDKNE